MRRTNDRGAKWLLVLGLLVGCDGEFPPVTTHGGADSKGEDGKHDDGDYEDGSTSGTAGESWTGDTTDGKKPDGHDSAGDGHDSYGPDEPDDEPWCGNGLVEANEACDGKDFGNSTCEGLGYDDGTLKCNEDCTLDKSKCEKFSCGDGRLDASEVCDGSKLDGKDCESVGYEAGGTLKCKADCMAFDTSKCISDCCVPHDTPKCQDDSCKATVCAIDPFCCETEWDEKCVSEAEMYCKTCGGHPPVCGNGIVEAKEVCDPNDLDDEDCFTQGYYGGGTLGCEKDCSGYDTSECIDDCCTVHQEPGCQTDSCEDIVCAIDSYCCDFGWDDICVYEAEHYCKVCGGKPMVCGDGIAEGPEECDGNDYKGQDCASLDHGGGTLHCADDCKLEFSNCVLE